MKIAIVTNFLYPEGLGGTELYCYQLANSLLQLGHEVFWFVPNFEQQDTFTELRGNGFHVVKFAAVDETLKPDINFISRSFVKEMQSRQVQVAHFNEFGGDVGISAFLLAETKKAKIVTIVTLHLVHYICQSGTMKYAGVQPCNGEMIPSRCAACYIFSGKTFSPALNFSLANIAGKLLSKKSVQSVTRIKRFMNGLDQKVNFISALREHADVVVSLTKWFRDVLLVNGIPAEKIMYVPQVSPDNSANLQPVETSERKGYVYIGRVDRPKGIDLILKIAPKLKKNFPEVFIDIYGPVYGPYTPDNRDRNSVYPGLDKFENVKRKGILQPAEVLPVMNNYKAVLLPSLVAEMAPLTIMEADRLKVPAIVSDVPGSAELVNQYDCGIVFKYNSADELYNKIVEIESGKHVFGFSPAENNFYATARRYHEIYQLSIEQLQSGNKSDVRNSPGN